ncbi:MAG: L-serine ammonia-lyase, iron-sulfur-dependent, subunit alpha [Erysipelotrichaceae bacterium]
MKQLYQDYQAILHEELVLASGCTEPIAIAFLAATCKELMDDPIERVLIKCSGNVIKNVKSVIIPNTKNEKGIKAACIAGLIAGDASKKMEVIENVSDQQIEQIQAEMKKDYIYIECLPDEANLSIKIKLQSANHEVTGELMHTHTNITFLKKDDQILIKNECDKTNFNSVLIDRSILNIEDIIDFANNVPLDNISCLLKKQIEVNLSIAKEGFINNYGVQVGKTLYKSHKDIFLKCISYAASASDARMGGCKLPVMTNSGSGNQGITCSLPLIVYAKEYNHNEEQLLRSLIVANLITVHLKTGIGRLSAYCGVVCAACASFAAIAHLNNYDIEIIKKVITNSLATSSGIICDGAKASCATKISTALFSSLLAYQLAVNDLSFEPGCGIVQENIEDTIKAVGIIGREGMKQTDEIVLDIMTKK